MDICNKCKCDKCKYNVNITPSLTDEECKEVGYDSCFNCDDCCYYSGDNPKLNKNSKYKCDKFQMTRYCAEVETKRKRDNFKIV